MPPRDEPTRRQFLSLLPIACVGTMVSPRIALSGLPGGADAWGKHPEPRPGIDASKVLKTDQLSNTVAGATYDLVREIPGVVDGIHCYCGCAELPGFYSLLSCYEEAGMAQFCEICQGEAKLAHSLHARGNSLAQIRTAIDALYG